MPRAIYLSEAIYICRRRNKGGGRGIFLGREGDTFVMTLRATDATLTIRLIHKWSWFHVLCGICSQSSCQEKEEEEKGVT